MNWDEFEGRFTEMRGKIKEKWGKLTDDDLDVIAGQRDQLVGKLQRLYGFATSDANREVEQFLEECKC